MRRVAPKALAALGGLAIATIAAVAVAATVPRVGGGERPARPSPRLPVPRITMHPDPIESSSTASFRFLAKDAKRLQCRLDDGDWRSCRSPLTYAGIATGAHVFSVRASAIRPRRHGRSRRFRWTRAESRPFTIVQEAGPGALYPGAAPSPIALRVENPNTIPIFVTGLAVSVATDPPGCDSASNLELIPSSASDANPVEVPAEGSIGIPSASVTAPSIRLLDLPIDQDACQAAEFKLTYTGSAHG